MSARQQYAPMYRAIKCSGSDCPDCGKQLTLLCARCMTPLPKFYLCTCGFIGEVGVGVVRRGKKAKS